MAAWPGGRALAQPVRRASSETGLKEGRFIVFSTGRNVVEAALFEQGGQKEEIIERIGTVGECANVFTILT